MNLQLISDSQGKVTGVYIPIHDWNELKKQYIGIKNEASANVPDWQINVVNERLSAYDAGTIQAQDFDPAMDDLENEL